MDSPACGHNVQHVGCRHCLAWRKRFNDQRIVDWMRLFGPSTALPSAMVDALAPKRWGEDR